jgi:hypothetical protein
VKKVETVNAVSFLAEKGLTGVDPQTGAEVAEEEVPLSKLWHYSI